MAWLEQWERVFLGLDRLRRIYSGREGGSANAVYDLHSFFLNAYHLRDWIAEDGSTGIGLPQIDAAIRASTELSVCADFANRLKHVVLTRHRLDPQTGVTRQDVTVRLPAFGSGNVATASHSWTISAGGRSYDALELAGDVVAAWTTFLQGHGLI
jgi:hypothetical protein